jgi:hypothetical protein
LNPEYHSITGECFVGDAAVSVDGTDSGMDVGEGKKWRGDYNLSSVQRVVTEFYSTGVSAVPEIAGHGRDVRATKCRMRLQNPHTQ